MSLVPYQLKQRCLSYLVGISAFLVVCLLLSDPCWAVTVEELKVPFGDMRKQIFETWMFPIKVIAAAAGIVMSVVKHHLLPMATGVGVALGIHVFAKWLENGADAFVI